MPLEEYQKKRHFEKTPEPEGKPKRASTAKSKRLSFVIQKHDASRLHYDFRLELDGVMVSWAVPKGPSLDTREKRLAMHVEDHPLDYASFEGMIPEGEYGAGTVVVWDRGWWEPLPADRKKPEAEPPDPAESLARGELKFHLHGEKLEGGWVLVRLKPREGERGESWLLIKERDEFVRPIAEYDVLKERPESVKTGRTLEEVTAEESGPERLDLPLQPPRVAACDFELEAIPRAPGCGRRRGRLGGRRQRRRHRRERCKGIRDIRGGRGRTRTGT